MSEDYYTYVEDEAMEYEDGAIATQGDEDRVIAIVGEEGAGSFDIQDIVMYTPLDMKADEQAEAPIAEQADEDVSSLVGFRAQDDSTPSSDGTETFTYGTYHIGVVRVNDKLRTRVMCHQINSTDKGIGSKVFDFPQAAWASQIKSNPNLQLREDFFDYDFDVTVEQTSYDAGLWNPLTKENVKTDIRIHMVLVSGVRGEHDDLAHVVTNQVICYSQYRYTVLDNGAAKGRDAGFYVKPAENYVYGPIS